MEGGRMSGFGGHRPHWPRAILFDLDGTLIDSAPDIRAAVNELIARHELGPLTLDQVKSMIGNGVQKLVERAFAATAGPLAPDELQREYMAMVDIYANHLTKLTTLTPGAREALGALNGEGVLLALVTNKPQRFIETILDHFRLSRLFGAVIGGDAGVAKKPAPDMLLAAAEQLGIEPWDAVMVGDSASDVEAARAAGVLAIIVRGGYSSVPIEGLGADAVVESLAGLAGALRSLSPPA
jgi:phosphoglycolate phosphatase